MTNRLLLVNDSDKRENTMKREKLLVIVLTILGLTLVFLAGTQAQQPTIEQTKKVDDLSLLVSYMSGYFSSQSQAEADSSYFDIRLHMKPIWLHRSDAHWFYVEQAVASHQDQPYRQRVYRVSQVDDTTFSSQVFTMEEPMRFAGSWKDTLTLASLSPDSLTERSGCAIILQKSEDGSFHGSTVGMDCESKLHGAAYATSEVQITESRVYSWDRGFDKDSQHVWGAEKGGYSFEKIKSY